METAKKRKRDDEVDPPRITYDAATRTFDRLFKEESLGEMKNVVRKKLGVSTAVPVYLSQIRDGKSVDLDDDEDFEAFRAATRSLTIAKIKVVLGGHPTNGQLVNGSAIEPKTPKRKKKKQRISDAIASTSSVLSERPFGEPPATNEESISTPHKKRRVSFLEPPTLEQISTQSLLPETPKKKKTKPTGDPLPKSAIANEADVQFIQQLPETDTDEQAPRTKKKKKNLDQPKGDISGLQQDEVSSTISQVTDTASAQADESTSKKSKKKRRREDPEPNVITEPEDNASTSAVQAAKQLAQEEDTTRPAKKSKKQNADPTDEVTTKKSSRSKSVPPPAVEPPAAAAPVLDDEEPEAPSTKAKKTKKKKDREVSEPPTKEVATKPAHLEEQEDEAVVPPKKKSKFKQKDVTVLDETNPDTSKPTASLNKSLEKEKLAEVSSASAIEPSGSLNDDQPPEKAQKSSKKDRSRSKAPEEDVQPEDVEPTTVDEPKRKRKKSAKAASASEEHEETEPLEKSKKTQDVREQEKAKAAVKASIQAVLARKTAPTAPTSVPVPSPTEPTLPAVTPAQPNTSVEPPVAQPTLATPAPVLEPAVEKDRPAPEPSSSVTKPANKMKAPPPSTCPFCDESPFHFKTKCPIMSGIRLMRKRLAELEGEVGEDVNKRVQRAAAMAELHSMIKKKTRKPKILTTAAAAATRKGKGKATTDIQEDEGLEEEEDTVIHSKKKGTTKSVAADRDEDEDEEHEGEDEEEEQTGKRKSKRTATLKPKPNGKSKVNGKSKTQEESEREDFSEDDVPVKEPHKQVDVIASTTARVVDVHPRSSVPPPPSSSPAPPSNIPPLPSTQPQKNRNGPLTSTPRSSSQPHPSKHTALLQRRNKNGILPSQTPSQELADFSIIGDMSTLGDLSQYTDKDVEMLLYPKMSIKDVDFLDEGEDTNADKLEDDPLQEEEAKEEEDMKKQKKHNRGTRDSPSSNEGEGEEEEDEEKSVDRGLPSRSPSLEPLVEAAEPPPRRSVSKGLLGKEPNPSFREVDTRGSSREMDKSGNDAVEDALLEDLAPLELAATINKAMEPDSDTAVASNGEDAVPEPPSPGKPASVGKLRQRSDSIEEPLEDGGRQLPDPIVSDDGAPLTRPTQKVEVVIRTRSQKKKVGQSSTDLKKLSELPIPSPSIRIIKPSPTTTPRLPPIPARLTRGRKGVVEKRGRSSPEPQAEEAEEADSEGETPAQAKTRNRRIPKAVSKSAKPPSKAASIAASQTSLITFTAKPLSTNGQTPADQLPKTPEPKKASPKPKVVPLDPENQEEEEKDEQGSIDPGTQWATLKEGQVNSRETPGQLDELISSNGSHREPSQEPASSPSKLFLPSETQPSFPYSQFADTPGSQPQPEPADKPSPNESVDEDEVANTVMKPRPPKPQFRGLSQMAGSQFATPKFKTDNFGNIRRPKDDLYGMVDTKDDSGSDSDTDSESDEQPLASQSHIAPSRRAGVPTAKR